MTPTNVITRALLALGRRRERSIATILAIVVCSATLVALLGISESSAAQTARRFEKLQGSSITATINSANAWEYSEQDMLHRLKPATAITSAGTLINDAASQLTVKSPQWHTTVTTSAVIGTPQGVEAIGGKSIAGRLPTDIDADVFTAALGKRVAKELGISMEQRTPTITINGVSVGVTGIVADKSNGTSLSASIFLSPRTAKQLGLRPQNRTIICNAASADITAVAAVLPRMLNPSNPQSVTVKAPGNPATLRASLLADAHNTSTIIAAVLAVVTAFGIVNTMQMAVTERRREIGINLALGMPAWKESIQFLCEAIILGGIGASGGMLIGAVIAAVTAAARSWVFLLPSTVLLVAPLGIVTGAIAGIIPAWRAARIDPAMLLRSS